MAGGTRYEGGAGASISDIAPVALAARIGSAEIAVITPLTHGRSGRGPADRGRFPCEGGHRFRRGGLAQDRFGETPGTSRRAQKR